MPRSRRWRTTRQRRPDPPMAEKFGRLLLVKKSASRSADGHVVGIWRCDCGTELKIMNSRVRNGYTVSCGCFNIDRSRECNTIHGMRGSKEYSAWMGMKARCHCQKNKDYHRYGARGIRVCATWRRDFEAFLSHIGPCPNDILQVDRIDNDIGYQPGNVRWATSKKQACNRRGTFVWSIRGITFESGSDAASHFVVTDTTINRWVNGHFDKRRGTFTAPRKDCHATPRY